MTDYRSPATTTNHYANNDPSALATGTGNVKLASGHVATLGHPADGVAINEAAHSSHTTHTTAHTATATHHVPVATTHTTTTTHAAPTHAAAPVAGPHHTVPSGATGDGLVVASNLGGPMGGTVVLGGQCECTRNGGKCAHGAGQCSCRGCTTAATSLNPGINIGVSTHQYTAPVGTSGIGGGVASPGVGMAGMVNPTNAIGAPVTTQLQNCDCVKRTGACACAPGQCSCTNCTAHRKSVAATQATAGTHTTHTTHHTTALGGSEYVGGQQPNYTHSTTATHAPVTVGTTGPVTDNSNVPYKASDYTEGKPVNSNSGVI